MSTASIIQSLAEKNGCSARDIVEAAISFEETGEVPEGVSLSPQILAMVVSIGGPDLRSSWNAGGITSGNRPQGRVSAAPRSADSTPAPTTSIPIIKRDLQKPAVTKDLAFPKRQEALHGDAQSLTLYDRLAKERGVVIPPASLRGSQKLGVSQAASVLDQNPVVPSQAPPTPTPMGSEEPVFLTGESSAFVGGAVEDTLDQDDDAAFDAKDLLVSLGIEDDIFEKTGTSDHGKQTTYSPFAIENDTERSLDASQGPLLTQPEGETVSVIDDIEGSDITDSDVLGEVFSFTGEGTSALTATRETEVPEDPDSGLYLEETLESWSPSEESNEEASKETSSPLPLPTQSFDEIISGTNESVEHKEEQESKVEDAVTENDSGWKKVLDAEDTVVEQQPAPKKKTNRLLIALVIILTLLALVMFGAMFFGYTLYDIFGVGYAETYSPLNFFVN